jgi:hypothetical protein
MAAMIAPIREADAHRRPDNALAGAGDGCGAKFSRRAKRGNFLFKSDALRLWDCAEYRLVVADITTCRGLRNICTRAARISYRSGRLARSFPLPGQGVHSAR